MTRCNEHLLHLYLDREITHPEKALLQEHMQSCTNCRKKLNQLKVLDWNLHSLPEPPPPGELSALRRAALDEHLSQLPDTKKQKKSVVQLQYHTFKYSLRFFQLVPGNTAAQKSIKRLGKYLPFPAAFKPPLTKLISF